MSDPVPWREVAWLEARFGQHPALAALGCRWRASGSGYQIERWVPLCAEPQSSVVLVQQLVKNDHFVK